MVRPSFWPILVIAFITTSCSALAIQRAPANPKAQDVDCTDSLTYPLIDMSATVLSGVLAINLISVDRDDDETPIAGLVVGTLALAAATSAVYGTYHVDRCRDAKAASNTIAPVMTPANQHRIGSQGGRCNPDGTCNETLKCDTPMQVCVPDDVSEFNSGEDR